MDGGADTGAWDLDSGAIEFTGGNYDINEGFINPSANSGSIIINGGSLVFNTTTDVILSSNEP